MTVTDWIVLWCQATLLAGASLVACRIFRGSPRTVQLITRASLCLLIALLIIPAAVREIPRPINPAVAVDLPQMLYAKPAPRPATANEVKPTDPQALEAADGHVMQFAYAEAAIACAWGFGSMIALAGILLGIGRIFSLKRRSNPVEATVQTLPVRESVRVSLPFVAGLIKPTIYVPQNWTAETDHDCQRSILRHEMEHVHNGDLRWMVLHRILCAIFWPVPFVWMLRKPMMLAAEQICDDAVLRDGASATDYAQCLLDLRQTRRLPMLAIGAADRRSSFSHRIRSILSGHRVRRLSGMTKASVLLLVLAVGLAAFLAIGAKRQSSAPEKAPVRHETMTVNVLDQKGNPIKEGTGHLIITGGSEPVRFDVPIKDGKAIITLGTSADLAKRFPEIGPYGHYLAAQFWFYERGSALTSVRIWPNDSTVQTIHLEKGSALKSSIVDTHDMPIADVQVYPVMLVNNPSSDKVSFIQLRKGDGPIATTGSHGQFVLPDLPSGGKVRIETSASQYAQPGMMSDPTLKAGTTIVKPYRLALAGVITGQVTKDGVGIAGIRVAAQATDTGDGWASGFTDRNGSYSLGCLSAGTYNVALYMPNTFEFTARAAAGVFVTPDATIVNQNLKLETGCIIQGVVKGDDGRPRPFGMVGCYGPAHPRTGAWVQSAVADEKGRYSMRVPAGDQYVYLMDSRDNQVSENVSIRDGETKTVDLRGGH